MSVLQKDATERSQKDGRLAAATLANHLCYKPASRQPVASQLPASRQQPPGSRQPTASQPA